MSLIVLRQKYLLPVPEKFEKNGGRGKIFSENENGYVEKDHNFGTAHRLCVGMRCPIASSPIYNTLVLVK